MNAAETYLKQILDLMLANSGMAIPNYLGTDIPLLAAQSVIPADTYDSYQVVELWNLQYKGVYVMLDIAEAPGGDEAIQLFVDILNPGTGQYFAIAQGAAQTAAGRENTLLYPVATDTDSLLDQVVQLPLPRRWRIRVTHSGAGDWVYSVGIQYVQ